MAGVPSLPLFVDDYEAATAHLTLEEDGAYTRLLRLCWRTPGCSIPNDPEWIARKMRVDLATFDRVVAPIIKEFFRRSRGRLFQKRLAQEFAYVESLSKARKEAGKRGGISRALKNNENGSSKANGLHGGLPEQKDGKAQAPILTPTPTLFPEDKSSGAADSDKVFWDTAKAYLADVSKDPGALIGMWCRDHGKAEAASAITRAQIERPVEKIPFIQGCLRHSSREPERPIC